MTCNSGRCFIIHQTVLDNAPNLKIYSGSDGSLHANVDASPEAVEAFAQWLYTGTMPEPANCDDSSNIDYILEAHALGRTIGSVDFMDTSLDFAIGKVLLSGNFVYYHEILNAFTAEFSTGSAGRKFTIDFALRVKVFGSEIYYRSTYADLGEVDDEEVITELVRRVMDVTGFRVTDNTRTHEIKTMLISGFFDARDFTCDFDLGARPWEEDKCQYHRHTELGLPCYTKNNC